MRVNNKAARLAVNAWLKSEGRETLSPELSYEDFALELRKMLSPQAGNEAFSDRPKAVAYIREIATTKAWPKIQLD